MFKRLGHTVKTSSIDGANTGVELAKLLVEVRLNGLSRLHLCTETSGCDAISSRNSLVRGRYKGPVH